MKYTFLVFSALRLHGPCGSPGVYRARHVWLSLIGAIAMCACASQHVAPTELPSPPIPAQWLAAPEPTEPTQAVPSLATWWQRFNDPTLSALVLRGLQSNADVRSALAALQQSRALRDVRAAGLAPRVGGSASAQSSRSGSADRNDTFQLGFDASWEPDVFGGKHSALNAAEADAQAARATLGQVQVSMAAEIALVYIDLRGLQVRLAIARSNLAVQAQSLQLARWRGQAGLVSSLDVEQALAASEQTAAQIPTLLSGLAQDVSALAVLTGQEHSGLREQLLGATESDTNPQIPQATPGLAVAIPAQTLRQRADVRAAQYRMDAALAQVAQADAARYPSFQLSGSIGLRALTLGALTAGGSVVQSVLAGVSVPVLDAGASQAQVRAQQAAWDQSRVAYQKTIVVALKDVEDALIALQSDTERLGHLQAAAAAAANADLMARQRYASGLIDFRVVLDTQRTLLSTQDAVASTRVALSADHVRLYKALGGGWLPESESIAQ